MSGLLSGSQITAICLNPNEREKWVQHFENSDFSTIGYSIVGITPLEKRHAGPIGYDLSVGHSIYSLRDNQKKPLDNDTEPIRINPGETVLVLTREYIALGPKVAAVTLSRARIMNEGISLSSAKIDPTWYGCLLIPITNNSRSTFSLKFGQRFCTMLMYELAKEVPSEHYLNKDNTPHLGQTTLNYEPRHTIPWQPIRPDKVSEEDMDAAVDFGPPFDIIRGMFSCNQKNIIDYMEKIGV